ncbi:MAG TPA: aspartate--tRNA(Asn) ligase [Oculatellaceae cyanobacterium]
MEASLISVGELSSRQGQTTMLQGHVQTVRDLGQIIFLMLRDQSGLVQVIVEQPELLETARSVSVETPIRVEGSVVMRPKSSDSYELHASKITVLSELAEPLPVEIGKAEKMKNLSLSAMLDYRPVTLRSPASKAVFKIEAAFCAGFRQYLNSKGFTEIHSPKIVSTGTEGGAQLFKIDYFGTPAYLAQSPQFYKQIMVGVFERVFEIGPVYRAEEHDTTRHLNEYVSMDFEMGFIESEQDLIAMQTGLLRHMFETVRESCPAELELFKATLPAITTIPQITLADAIDLLQLETKWRPAPTSEDSIPDLDPEGERLLTQYFAEHEGSELVYVTRYPHSVRPFYAMPVEEAIAGGRKMKLSRSFDLLYRGLEITTGGQRLHKPTELKQSMQERGLDPNQFGDYLQCFRYGMPPHGGLAIGLERLAKQLLGLPTVKLAALFPRDINRLRP